MNVDVVVCVDMHVYVDVVAGVDMYVDVYDCCPLLLCMLMLGCMWLCVLM